MQQTIYLLKNRYLHVNDMLDENVGVKLNKTQIKIVELMKNNPNIIIEEMAKDADVETRTIERNIKVLKEKGMIDRIGADKNGYWVVKI